MFPTGRLRRRRRLKTIKTVIIEFQLCGNRNFLDRIFYYISKNIVNELHEGEDYQEVQKIISINLLDFNLDFGDEGKLEGIKEGIKKGIKDEKYSIAKILKQMNMDEASIRKATGLSIEEIENL